jgi:outer membrane immunogenic protein
MFQKLSALALLSASLGFAASASADTGLYVGGSVGQTTVKASENAGAAGTLHFDEDDTSYKLFVGYMVLPFVGFEGGYTNLGNPSKNFSGANAEFEVDAWEAFVVGVLPLGPVDGASINIDAKVRVAGSTVISGSDSDEKGAYGVGAAFGLGGIKIRAEYTEYDVGNDIDDLYMASVGVTYLF